MKKAIKFSKIMLVVMFVSMYIFIAYVLYIFKETGTEPTALIAMVGGSFSIELAALARIKIEEVKNEQANATPEVNTEEVPIYVAGFTDSDTDYSES